MEGGAKDSGKSKNNPKLGAFYMQLFVFFQSMNWFLTKLVYVYYPSIHFLQIMWFRNIMSTALIFAITNK